MRKTAVRCAVLLAAALPVAAAAQSSSYVIPEGTHLHVELTTTLTTKVNQVGDLFSGQITEPIFANHEEAVPTGSTVRGHITLLTPPGRHVKAEIRLSLDSITTPNGIVYHLASGLQGIAGGSNAKMKGKEGVAQGPGKSKKKTAEQVGIGAGAGAAIGAIAAGGPGALYGMGIGAAALFIRRMLKKNKDIVLVQGTHLIFEVPRAITATRVRAAAATASQ